ncbi:arginine-ornithine antiporter [Rhizobium sp. R72]|uniref:basic amino acid/polyamine antiporter n=1 Tax=unclassified Rhizobium TaxID=2613769 RepID=UPI000B5322E1|nr:MULTISPECIES: basic amino acid/polyamine antiporter [unclassified Rhizobium]OWV92847.1 arginine-ornithine antiporter [Rhizobium sp. R72]OWV93058.1 arginine-ornithine antiporter [Rhizobium sp. R711]
MSASSQQTKFAAWTLMGIVVGSMVGAGIFSLPQAFGQATGPLGAVIAWTIAGVGMLMVAFVFQTLSERRPDLDAGIYAYAKEGFGNYAGFLSALGYWSAALLGNVSYFVLIKSTLGLFFPVFGDGNTVIAVATSSCLLWAMHWLILQGIRQAAALNAVVTAAKLIPIMVFILLVLIAFKWEIFSSGFWGSGNHTFTEIANQVRSTMLVTVFVFVGIEGASVYSRYAKNRSDVGVATVGGFLIVLGLMLAVTLLSYGILLPGELARLRNPSMAGVLAAAVGPWGAVFVSAGLIISVAGAYLAWVLLAAEILYSASKYETMPRFLSRENRRGVPANALWLTNILVQLFLLITLFTQYAFALAVAMTSSMILIPYFFVAAYGVKLCWRMKETSRSPSRTEFMQSLLALIYTGGLIYAAGAKHLLLTTLLYCPGTVLFFLARREQRKEVFNRWEKAAFALLFVSAVAAIFEIANGAISI